MDPIEASEFGVYVHWPYCSAICPYCDFNVFRARGDDGALLAAVLADIAGWRAQTGPRDAGSIYLGGGTPSLLEPRHVGAILDAAASAWTLAPDVEVTLEVNPEDADAERFAGYRAAGVNRLSIGVQALNDAALKGLGRAHDAAQGLRALELALNAMPAVTFDLIYARDGQTLAQWEAELREALTLGATHLSLYQLTIEPGTAFARQVERGRRALIEEDAAADFYELTAATTRDAGMPAYEISNHAAGRDAQARHNLLYWRSQDWAGIGPGAHGRLGRRERRALKAASGLRAYRQRVAEAGWGVEEEERLGADAQSEEFLLMGLRLEEGVSLARWEAISGRAPPVAAIAALVEDGLILHADKRLRLTPRGRLAADRVAAALASA